MTSTAVSSGLSGSVAAISKFADGIVDILSVPRPIIGLDVLRAMSVATSCVAKLRPALERDIALAPAAEIDPDDEIAELLVGVQEEFARLDKSIADILLVAWRQNFMGWLVLKLVRRSVRKAFRQVEELRQFIRERDADVSPSVGTFSDDESLQHYLRGL